MSSGEVQSFADEDGLEDLKHDDIASGLPFMPVSLVSASQAFLTSCCSAVCAFRLNVQARMCVGSS